MAPKPASLVTANKPQVTGVWGNHVQEQVLLAERLAGCWVLGAGLGTATQPSVRQVGSGPRPVLTGWLTVRFCSRFLSACYVPACSG